MYKTQKDWARFGKDIYDKSMNMFYDSPCKYAIIPIHTEDAAIARVTVEHRSWVDIRHSHDKDGNLVTEFWHGYPMSDGTIKWKKG